MRQSQQQIRWIILLFTYEIQFERRRKHWSPNDTFFVRTFFVQYLARTIHRHGLINLVCASLQPIPVSFFFHENIVCRGTFYVVRMEASTAIAIIEIFHVIHSQSNRTEMTYRGGKCHQLFINCVRRARESIDDNGMIMERIRLHIKFIQISSVLRAKSSKQNL